METIEQQQCAASYEFYYADSFKRKTEMALLKAGKFVKQWLKRNKIICYELTFDWKRLSEERDMIQFLVRAIDKYHRRAYIFEVMCNGLNFEVYHEQTSQNPRHFSPGNFTLQISDVA